MRHREWGNASSYCGFNSASAVGVLPPIPCGAGTKGGPLMLQLHSIEEFTATGMPVTLMSCVGTLSADDISRLRDQLRVQMRHGSRHLLLDLTDVTSADRLIAALLADANSQARAAACTLTLIAPDRHTVPGLDLGYLNQALPVYPNVTQALTALDISDNDL